MMNLVLSIFTLLLAMKGSVSVNVLESTPPSVNGVLTACAGQQISLTCSHNVQVGPGSVTFWKASPPANCSSAAIHFNGQGDPCGSFMLGNITRVEGSPPSSLFLHSTAMARAAVYMTNTTIECSSGNPVPVSIGNITLCIVASLPPPTNLVCDTTSGGLNVIWELGVDTSCNVNYIVTVVRESDMMTITSHIQVTETTVELTNTLVLEPNTISVRALTAGGSCESQEANIMCVTPPDLRTEATPPTSTSRGLSAGVIAAIVVVFIVLIIVAVVIVIVVVIVIRIYPRGKRRDQDGVHDSLGGEQQNITQ